jgi:hypothetical protein
MTATTTIARRRDPVLRAHEDRERALARKSGYEIYKHRRGYLAGTWSLHYADPGYPFTASRYIRA